MTEICRIPGKQMDANIVIVGHLHEHMSCVIETYAQPFRVSRSQHRCPAGATTKMCFILLTAAVSIPETIGSI